MSAPAPSGRTGLVTQEQVLRAINASRSDVPVGPATLLEAAGVIADLADHLADRLRPMLSSPHPPGEWRQFTRWFTQATQVQSIVDLLTAVERITPAGPCGDATRAAVETVRAAVLDIPRAHLRRVPAWDAPAEYEDDPWDPHGYRQRAVHQWRVDPDDVRDMNERLDRLIAAGEWLWRAVCKVPAHTTSSKPESAAVAALANATGLATNERKMVDLISANGGQVSLSDLAAAMQWHNPDDNFNSASRRLNEKLKRLKPNGVKVSRENSVVVAKLLPALGRK